MRCRDVVTVYNPDGSIQAKPLNAYNLKSITAHRVPDGSMTGRRLRLRANCLSTKPGCNDLVGPYRPRAEILNSHGPFPRPNPWSKANPAHCSDRSPQFHSVPQQRSARS
jgi:hypothetical protein